VLISTSGDKVRDRPIAEVGELGVFVKELENALLLGEVDIVVHSLKDLPTALPPSLTLACVCNREDPRDVLVSRDQLSFNSLPLNAVVATSSRRRTAQLLAQRQDLNFIDIRGNIPTRLKKHDDGQCDAIILAAAGLIRLGLTDRISEYLDTSICLPAVGQGALAAECRSDDLAICQLLEAADDHDVRAEVTAERAFLAHLGGGCSVPIGALSRITGDRLSLTGCVAALDGSRVMTRSLTGSTNEAEQLGQHLAQIMLKDGAESILHDLRLSQPNAISAP
jgi:hydroxymethylbilane synthase